MEVTPTAVRQRLTRLLAGEVIQREPIRNGRGRPKHRYWLTDKGMRRTGSNFADLAMALVGRGPPEGRRRAAARDAAADRPGVGGRLRRPDSRAIPPPNGCSRWPSCWPSGGFPFRWRAPSQGTVLTAHACPYPKLAEQDQDICTVERMMFSELLGQDVELTECRLQGGGCCRFQTG